MLVSMVELMQKARQEGYCVPAPAVENEHTVRACIAAAEAKNSPLILISLFKVNPDIMMFGRIITDIALRTRVPIAICQDHGGTYEEAVWAIRAGYTDIMVDRSSLPYEENVAQVKELVKIAHAVGVGVEAELGHVGTNSDGPDDSGGGVRAAVSLPFLPKPPPLWLRPGWILWPCPSAPPMDLTKARPSSSLTCSVSCGRRCPYPWSSTEARVPETKICPRPAKWVSAS